MAHQSIEEALFYDEFAVGHFITGILGSGKSTLDIFHTL